MRPGSTTAYSLKPMSFADIEAWAKDDSMVLESTLIKALKTVLDQASMKARVMTMMLVRRRLQLIQDFQNQADGVETVLFDKRRIEGMRNKELISVYSLLTKRVSDHMDAFTKTVLDPKQDATMGAEELALCVEHPVEEPKIGLAEDAQRKLFQSLMQLADTVSRKERGFVAPPPKVC